MQITMTDGHGKRFTVKLKAGTTEKQAQQVKEDLIKAGGQRIGTVISR